MTGAYSFLKTKETFSSFEFTCGEIGTDNSHKQRKLILTARWLFAEIFIRRYGDSKLFHLIRSKLLPL
jgi:hypothetical protein